ncbi:ankyrin repeat-containing protein-like protein [Hyaloscypha finlandica]|nr:ankyrin repeat-containing protein-like protein [Hyaloscypha finlandica]
MDPISVTASVIAVATLAAQIAAALSDLRTLCKQLPGRLHALSNEVSDVEVVLIQVAKVIEERSCSPIATAETDHMAIPQLLRKAEEKLKDLKAIIDNLAASSKRNNVLIFRAGLWRKEQPRLHALQEDIKAIKSSLNVILGASNSREMMRVRLDLETLSTATTQSVQEAASWDEFLRGIALQHKHVTESVSKTNQQVDQRISRVEEMLRAQSAQVQASQLAQIGPLYNMGPPNSRRRLSRTSSKDSVPQMPARSEAVGFRLTQYAALCRPGCLCACHSQRKSTTPGFMDRMLGQLFVGYAGMPLLSQPCDTGTCDKPQVPHVSFEYWFPLGFYISEQLRRVPDSAQCVSYALEGNIEGLKILFKHGLASPRDVSSTRGYSILRWALYGQQYETCKFLLSAGADSDYRPISVNDDCPSDKACDIILRGGLSERTIEILRCLAAGSDFIENQNFALIHKIVLKLSLQDLEKEILRDPDDVDIPDAMGRTALEWAAARGDDRAVTTLLSYGADLNIMDKKLNTPLTLASNQNQTVCVRLLLEAGANPDPTLPDGIKFGSPLNCAARNASDPLLIKTLLDFNADIEASNVDGVTPLLHVARGNSASHAMILLEYGAQINVTSKDGRTPLTAAIVYNNHNVLQLLLDRWYEYSECPRLKGPHLLSVVAQYADLQTISILASTDHLKLKFDKDYMLGDFSTRLRQRTNVTGKLTNAFEDLLNLINQGSNENESMDSRMESGLLERQGSESPTHSSEGSDEAFEDAQESFTEQSCPVIRLVKRSTI